MSARHEAEISVAGLALLEPEFVYRHEIPAAAFSQRKIRVLWETLQAMHAEGEPIDRITVAARLEGLGMFDAAQFLEAALGYVGGRTPELFDAHAAILLFESEQDQIWRDAAAALRARDEAELVRLGNQITARAFPGRRRIVQGDLVDGWRLHVEKRKGLRAKYRLGVSKKLDRALGAVYPGRLYTVAARPGVGKTACALNVAVHNARDGHCVGFISVEQSIDELSARTVAIVSGCSLAQIMGDAERTEFDTQQIREAVSQLANLPIEINDQTPTTIEKIAGTVRHMIQTKGIEILIVDYLQKISRSGKRDRSEELGVIAQGLKDLGRIHNLPVIVLAQLKRDAEGREPVLSDLGDSGEIERESDVVIGIYRDRDAEDKACSLILMKNRHGPSGMKFDVAYEGRSFRFGELEKRFDGGQTCAGEW